MKRSLDSSPPLPHALFGIAYQPLALNQSLSLSNDDSFNLSNNGTLAKRQVSDPSDAMREKEFMLGSFKCNAGSPSPCAALRDLERWGLAKRAIGDCPTILPRLYCERFLPLRAVLWDRADSKSKKITVDSPFRTKPLEKTGNTLQLWEYAPTSRAI